MTIAIDFDGTVVEHCYPEIGREIPFATETLRMLIKDGHKLILWSVREDRLLDEAVNWCKRAWSGILCSEQRLSGGEGGIQQPLLKKAQG